MKRENFINEVLKYQNVSTKVFIYIARLIKWAHSKHFSETAADICLKNFLNDIKYEEKEKK